VKKLYLILLILLLSSPAWAATVYVKDTGAALPYYEVGASSCGDVTAADTNANMQAALNASDTNGILNICPGTYTDTEIDTNAELDTTHTGQTIQGSTGNRDDVILTANTNTGQIIDVVHEGATVQHLTIKGDGVNSPYRGLQVNSGDGAANTLLNNLIVEDCGNGGPNQQNTPGIYLLNAAGPALMTDIELTDIIVRNNDGFGVVAWNWVGDVTYTRVTADGNGQTSDTQAFSGRAETHYPNPHGAADFTQDGATDEWYIDFTAQGFEPAIVVWITTPTLLTKNTVSACDGGGDDLAANEWCYDGSNILRIDLAGTEPNSQSIEYFGAHGPATYTDCVASNQNMASVEGNGFSADNGASNYTWITSLAYNNDGYAWTINKGRSNVIQNSIGYSNGQSGSAGGGVWLGVGSTFSVLNSTFYQNGDYGLNANTGAQVATITNNIFYDHDLFELAYPGGTFTITENYNDLYNPEGNARDAEAAAGPQVGAQSITGDPLFVNAAGGNFNLKTGSPAIDTGEDLGDTYTYDYRGRNQDSFGSGWEIGARIYPSRKIHRKISGQGVY